MTETIEYNDETRRKIARKFVAVMKAEEKREKKAARRQVEELFEAIVKERQPWLKTRPAKIRAAAKLMADRYYSEIIRPAADRITKALDKAHAQASAG
jgi:predicted metal-dependent hydrolase